MAIATAASTARLTIPPLTTDTVALPVSAARNPDSAAPSWFEAPMKIMLTPLTRPRSPSGVDSWMAVLRMTTLTWSAMPTTTYASTERGNERERPKRMVATP
jgi:hypothetical protein